MENDGYVWLQFLKFFYIFSEKTLKIQKKKTQFLGKKNRFKRITLCVFKNTFQFSKLGSKETE